MFLHQSADVDHNCSRAGNPWHMHHDCQIDRWEEEYGYTHIRVPHLRFRICELPHYHRVAQVAFSRIRPQFWCQLRESLCWGCTRVIAPPACLGILRCGILARDAAVSFIFSKHSWVTFHCSLDIEFPRKLNSPQLIFSDFGTRFLD